MKVALYVHCFYPLHGHGTESYTLLVAKELAARGHQVTVVTATFQSEPEQPQFIEERSWEGIPVISIDKHSYPNLAVADTYNQPVMQVVHEEILRRLAPDIVHVCHLVNHTAAVLDACTALGIPTVATFTDFFGFCYTNILEAADGSLCSGPNATRSNCVACHLKLTVLSTGPGRDWRSFVYPRILPYLARQVTQRSWNANHNYVYRAFRPGDLIERPDVLAKAMQVYRLAIAPTQFLQQAYRRVGFTLPMMLSRFGVDVDRSPKPAPPAGSPIRVGFIGQIARHKGVHILADAFSAAGRPNLSLTVWGAHDQQPDYFRHLQNKLRNLPVRFPGTFPVSDIVQVLGEIDVLVIPSIWYENSPLILLQALATHTPVIISDVAGMTELVEEGVNSFRFPRGDVDGLTSILRRVADNPRLLADMSLRTEYLRTSRDMVDDVIVAYETALAAPSPEHLSETAVAG